MNSISYLNRECEVIASFPPTYMLSDINISDSPSSAHRKKKKKRLHTTYPDPYFSSENKRYPISPYIYIFKSSFTSNPKAFHTFLNTMQASGFSVYFVFVLSYPFPFYICRSRFLLGNMGIMNDILSPSSVLCSSFYPSLCSLTAYSPTGVRGKNSLCPVFSFLISRCFPILWVLFCSPGKKCFSSFIIVIVNLPQTPLQTACRSRV